MTKESVRINAGKADADEAAWLRRRVEELEIEVERLEREIRLLRAAYEGPQ